MKKLLTLLALGFYTFSYSQNEATTSLLTESDKLKKEQADSLKNWKKGGVMTISGQQVSLTNWAAGGQSAISANGIVSLFATYVKGKNTWSNNLDMGYGLIRQGESKNWWKNDDRIQITSKYGRKAFDHVFYTGLVDFKTQFAPGYNYPNDSVVISNFLAPGYGLVALGLDYKPNENFSLLVAPLTGKFTIVNDQTLADAGAFGVDKAELYISAAGDTTVTRRGLKHREEFGGYIKMQYKEQIMENVTFQTMLELFTNYLEEPGNIDVNWTTLTSMKVNKYISATLSTQLIYDDDIKIVRSSGSKKGSIGPDVQFKQVLGIGFSYKF
ncbi:MAG: hypothetical protein K0S33_2956 [Bacteroidetes bacterium]|jgi:hypothetical protein|nr:hypothetical protein [Bacteroidota bacterium]